MCAGPLQLDTGLRRYFPDVDAPSFLFGDIVENEDSHMVVVMRIVLRTFFFFCAEWSHITKSNTTKEGGTEHVCPPVYGLFMPTLDNAATSCS